MTDFAMILKAEGKDYNPLTLNKYMTEKGFFDNYGGVKTDVLPDRIPEIKEETEKGAKKNLANGTPINLSETDSFLANGGYIIGQVKNPRGSQHWVLITGKNNGVYSIIDPGGIFGRFCKNVTLDAYNNKIYRAKIFTRK